MKINPSVSVPQLVDVVVLENLFDQVPDIAFYVKDAAGRYTAETPRDVPTIRLPGVDLQIPTNATYLVLSDSKVTPAGLKEVARFKSLATLCLSNGQLTDQALAALGSVRLLHTLSVASGKDGKRPVQTASRLASLSFLSCSFAYRRALSTRPLLPILPSCLSTSPSLAAAFAASARLRTSVAARTLSTSRNNCVTRIPVGLAIFAMT